jgi:hypothetical protein
LKVECNNPDCRATIVLSKKGATIETERGDLEPPAPPES